MWPRSRALGIFLIGGVLVVGSAAASVAKDDAAAAITSSDGTITLQLPPGVDASGVSVTLRSPDEFPAELGVTPAPHIEIEPWDLRFDPPARLIRRVPASVVGLDPAVDPLPVGVFVYGVADEPWAFARDLTFSVDESSGDMIISGDVERAGIVLTIASGAASFATDDLSAVGVGEVATLETSMSLGSSGAAIDRAATEIADREIATPLDGLISPMFGDYSVRFPIECRKDGEVAVQTRAMVSDYALEHPLPLSLGLTGTPLTLVADATLTCVG